MQQRLQDYLVRSYLNDRLDLAPGTAEQLAIAVRLFDRFLGRSARLGDLTRDNAIAWMRWLAESRAPRTVNGKRAHLLAIWRDIAAQGLVGEEPACIPRLREPDRIPEAFQFDEFQRLLLACRRLPGVWSGVPIGLCWQIAFLTIWDTGVRLGTLLSARLAHVDLESGVWRVPAEHQKGKRRDRLFNLHEQTIDVIGQSIPPERELLFPFPFRKRQVYVHLDRIAALAGLPRGRRWKFHCLRRSAESHAAATAGIEWAARAVGHTKAVAERYYISPLVVPQPSLSAVQRRPVIE